MKFKLLLFSCLLTTCLLSQKLYFVGEFSENQFKHTQKNIDKITNFKLYQKTSNNSNPIKIKSFKLNNVKLSSSDNPNEEIINRIINEFQKQAAKEKIIYISNTLFSTTLTQKLNGVNSIITFEEFTKNSYKYHKTVNLFLLLNSRFNLNITNPISESNTTNLSFKVIGTGSSNYPITKIKYTTENNNWKEIVVDEEIISNVEGEEFSFNFSPLIPESNNRTFSIKLILFNILNDSIQKNIKNITMVDPYISFEEFYNSDKDLGTLLPKRIDNLTDYKNSLVGIGLEIHLNTNINFYADEFKLKVEYFDTKFKKLDFLNFELDVIKCGYNSVIPVMPGSKTPLPYVANGDEVYAGQEAVYTMIPVGEQHLCDQAWEGYIRFSVPNTTVKTDFVYARMRGYNVGENLKFPLMECR
jgi:hypothetical protein